jgi:peptide/bleomycin uptake transporter
MFQSFFPRPILFFGSFALWALACVVFWHTLGQHTGEMLALGEWFGFVHLDYGALETLQNEAVKLGAKSDPAHMKLVQTQIAALQSAATFWTYQYLIPCYGLFIACWYFLSSHKWIKWSLFGSALIIFLTWFQVQLDVMINEWFGDFYNMIQSMFADPGSIASEEYYARLMTFFVIAGVFTIVRTLGSFFMQHYDFRWRTAMNEHYTGKWSHIRHIEGASQRIQDDTMRFADIMESLGAGFLDAVMTLIAFLPILWMLSAKFISAIPVVGPIAHGLVIVAFCWSVIGTILLALSGHKLPMLKVHNQRVEHAYRKELVFGEEDVSRAQPVTLRELFGEVRTNYFRIYFHYMYFNLVRYSYLQAGVLVPYIALAPTLVSKEAILAGFTLGVMQQIVRAFGRVESSFQYLVLNWPTIIEMSSIFKRLRSLDRAINDLPLPKVDATPPEGS